MGRREFVTAPAAANAAAAQTAAPAKTIADLGYTGYTAHGFRPTPGKDPIDMLNKSMGIMDV